MRCKLQQMCADRCDNFEFRPQNANVRPKQRPPFCAFFSVKFGQEKKKSRFHVSNRSFVTAIQKVRIIGRDRLLVYLDPANK